MTTDFDARYSKLVDHVRQTQLLQSAQALLEWDQQTYLPEMAGEYRAEQVSFMAGMIHQRKTDLSYSEQLHGLAGSVWIQNASQEQQTTIRVLNRDLDRNNKLPLRLVEELARACAVGQQVWVQARRNKSFSQFEPTLKHIFKLKQEQADALAIGNHRYDSLLDEFEPGATTAQVTSVLSGLVKELVPLLRRIKDSNFKPPVEIVHRPYPREQQERLGRKAAAAIGFDFSRGRLDITHHPFCTEIGPNDCRILTRYDERFFNTAFFGILHEAGHGMYEQGLRPDHYGLPPGQYCSLGVHESQSRLWENLVGRSHGFWQHFFPHTQAEFPDALHDVRLDSFHSAINEVKSSLIRVEADEVTYNLHIAIRFELESAVICGELPVSDLRDAWNEKYREQLGFTPADDAEGVLQDIHWSAGLIGYFPTYTLGNIYAAQLFATAADELGDLETMFSKGEFQPLKMWMNKHIHREGRRLFPVELIENATELAVSQVPIMQQLIGKYERIYQL